VTIIAMDVPAKIASVEAELSELKALLSITADKEERVALHRRIEAKENQLTECYKLLPRDGENFLFSYHFNFPIYSSVFLSFHTSFPQECMQPSFICSFISISICSYNF
jgi:hypothetical protein